MEQIPLFSYDWQQKSEEKDIPYLSYKTQFPQTLRILVLSNILSGLPQLYRLKNYLRSHPTFIDYTIVLGNFTNLSKEDKKIPENQARSEGEISSIFDYLENLGCKVLYIPAENDPDTLFEHTEIKRPKFTMGSYNVHKTIYKLSEGLILAGLGGHLLEDPSVLNDCSNFGSEGYFITSLRSLLQNASLFSEKSQILLSTYISPNIFETKFPNTATEYIDTIIEQKSKILGILHGNKNSSKSLKNTNGFMVINPGSLKNNNAGILELTRIKGKWEITSTELINLI